MNLPAIRRVLLVCSFALTACAKHDASTPPQQGTGGAPIDDAVAGGSGGMQAGGTGGLQARGGSASAEQDAGAITDLPLDASTSMDSATDEADAASAIDAASGPHPSLVGCRGPNEPGCAVCADGDHNFRSSHGTAGSGAYYNASSIDALCAPVCPPCASCTNAEQRGAELLGVREDCLPCSADPGIDPCFDVEGCGCWCAQRAVFQEACPTLVP